jgi:hypothetical protein
MVALLILSIASLFPERAFGLYNVQVPDAKQSQEKIPIKRTISLKLPIEDVQFHWEFLDRAELLAGKLLLRITRDKSVEEIVVFQDGEFSEGWGPMLKQSLGKTGADPIYFMFKSSNTYLTAPNDKVEILLVAKQDLKGIGALLSGHLPAGSYKSTASSSWLTDKSQAGIPAGFKQNAAFESWSKQWPLVVTKKQGWTPTDQANAVRKMMQQVGRKPEPVSQPKSPKARSCINNMRILDSATEQCAMANNLGKGEAAPRNEVSAYIKNGIDSLRCPSGGQYKSATVGADPTCSIHGALTAARLAQAKTEPKGRKAKTCRNNLRILDSATEQCAMANNLPAGVEAPRNEVSAYIKNGIDSLRCPAGGRYTCGTVGTDPTCSIHRALANGVHRR